MTCCYKNKILANETFELSVIVRFICTVIGNVYNGSKFRLTPLFFSVKAHDSLDIRSVIIYQSLKIQFLNKTDIVLPGPFIRNTGKI